MTAKNFSEEFHNKMRETFEDLWLYWHPPLNDMYTIDSLPQFEAALLTLLDEVKKEDLLKPENIPSVCMYAFYLGETLIRYYTSAKWVYPQGEGLPSAQVCVTQPNGEVVNIVPFNTIYKLLTGDSKNLMTIVDTYTFIMQNKHYMQNIEKGVHVKLPNGGYIRTHAAEDVM